MFEFIVDKCYVKSQVSKLIIFEGYLASSVLSFFPQLLVGSSTTSSMSHSGSFPLHKNVSSISYSVISNVNKPSTNSLWNYRLVHAHFPTIRLSLKYCDINISNKGNTLFCKSCCLSKYHIIHAHLSSNMYVAPFEVEHTYLWSHALVQSFTITLPLRMPTPSTLRYISWIRSYMPSSCS